MRSTAAIDSAWKQKDAEGVLNALNDYAAENEQVICLTVENSRNITLAFHLEPWGETTELLPYAKVHIFICEPKPLDQGKTSINRTYIAFSEENIILHTPYGALAYILPAPTE